MFNRMFATKRIKDIDLQGMTLKDVTYLFRSKESAERNQFYIANIIDDYHYIFEHKGDRSYDCGIHNVVYDSLGKKLIINSQLGKTAYVAYVYLLLPVIPLMLSNDYEKVWLLIGLALLTAIGVSLILFLGIRSESKRLEWEILNCTYYKLRQKR